MTAGEPIVAGLPAITMNFASPVVTNYAEDSGLQSSVLLQSSENSWLTTNTSINPDFGLYPERGFAVEGEQQPHPLAVVVQGSFTSFFEGKPSPFTADETTPPDPNAADADRPAARQQRPHQIAGKRTAGCLWQR
ncbi:MAG: hypothetical protein R2932_49640 [Caldilineaceae bacterium]